MKPSIYLYKDFIENPQQLFQELHHEALWQRDAYYFGDKVSYSPRLTAYFGEKEYKYSGITKYPEVIPQSLYLIINKIEEYIGIRPNSILLNYYRDEDDSISFHADNEPELGDNPIITSLSLGETRNLTFKHNQTGTIYHLPLEDNSLLVMGDRVQTDWKHCIKKCPNQRKQPRISLTFRQILSGE